MVVSMSSARRQAPSRTLLGLACAAALAGCAPAGRLEAGPPSGAALTETVRVFKGGWHTGFILARRDLTPERIPEIADFPEATHIEFSWGDRDYYRDPEPGLGTTLSAALTPTPAVMHIVGYARPPGQVQSWAETLEVPLSREELARLVAAIAGSFDRRERGRAARLEPGLYGRSFFYPATGRFHLFNTCNTWVARMLASAGVGTGADGVITADDLMDRLREMPRLAAARAGGPAAPGRHTIR
ncbi:MAG: DUF2459 domain-containing protein [Alphaproteobacteria bacterium]|nr:DUF2459 domain-containing protein [Alphaproteobacteria bacterium]